MIGVMAILLVACTPDPVPATTDTDSDTVVDDTGTPFPEPCPAATEAGPAPPLPCDPTPVTVPEDSGECPPEEMTLGCEASNGACFLEGIQADACGSRTLDQLLQELGRYLTVECCVTPEGTVYSRAHAYDACSPHEYQDIYYDSTGQAIAQHIRILFNNLPPCCRSESGDHQLPDEYWAGRIITDCALNEDK